MRNLILNRIKTILLPPRAIYYWLTLILWTLLIQSGLRLYFLTRHWRLANDIPATELFGSFLHGIRFDFVITGYIIAPFLVINIIPYAGFERSRLARLIIQPLMYFLFSLTFLLSLIDVEYFESFGEHLGAWSYAYFDNFGPVWATIMESYPVFYYVVAWLLLSALFVYVSHRLSGYFLRPQKTGIISRTLYSGLMIAVIIIGIRGGVSLAPIDWASAYHSTHFFANELTLNGVFTLSKSVFEYHDDVSRHDPSKYCFCDRSEALNTVQRAIRSSADSLLEPELSLRRITAYPDSVKSKQNVVIIFLESWSATYVGALGGAPPVTPFFDSLAQKGFLLENFYASGLRTNRGLLSVLCSFPSLPGRTVMKLYGSSHPFTSIGDILGGQDYQTHFIYGGDIDFDNMGGFFRNKGFENITSIDDFDQNQRLSKWGVPDHYVFEKANDMFSEYYPEPFLGVIVTLSNHRPFVIPGKGFEIYPPDVEFYDHLNAFYYSDWALGHYFELAQHEEYFTNTIFVLVGDHGQVIRHPREVIKNFRIASLIYCPGRTDLYPRRVKTICGQVDLLPTILGLLKLETIHESWGRDILALDSSDGGFAFINKGDTYGWIENSYLFYEKVDVIARLFEITDYSPGQTDVSENYPEIARTMQRKGRAMLQLEVEMTHDVK